MVEFRSLRERWRAISKIAPLDFRRADFSLFVRVSEDKTLERKVAQESWLILIDHLI